VVNPVAVGPSPTQPGLIEKPRMPPTIHQRKDRSDGVRQEAPMRRHVTGIEEPEDGYRATADH